MQTDEKNIVLPPHLVRGSLASLRDAMLAALEDKQAIRLDGRDVETVDSAGIHVLLAAERSARETDVEMTLNEPSEMLTRALADHRVGQLFAD